VVVRVVTTDYGNEVYWHVDDGESHGPYDDNSENLVQVNLQEPQEGEHTITLTDTYGDGWHGGYWEVIQDGVKVAGGAMEGKVQGTGGTVSFTIAPSGPTAPPTPAPSAPPTNPTASPTQAGTGTGGQMVQAQEGEEMVPPEFDEDLWTGVDGVTNEELVTMANQQATCECAGQQGGEDDGSVYYSEDDGDDVCTCAVDPGQINYAEVLLQAGQAEQEVYPAGSDGGDGGDGGGGGGGGGETLGEDEDSDYYYYYSGGSNGTSGSLGADGSIEAALASVPSVLQYGCLAGGEGLCGNGEEDGNCAQWAANGECDSNAAYMLVMCKKTCGSCGAQQTATCAVTQNWAASVQAVLGDAQAGTAEGDAVMAGVCTEMHMVLAAVHHEDRQYAANFGGGSESSYYYYSGDYGAALQSFSAYYEADEAQPTGGAYYTELASRGGGSGGGGGTTVSPAGLLRYGSPAGAEGPIQWAAGGAVPGDASCFTLNLVNSCTSEERTLLYSLMHVCQCAAHWIGDGYCDHEQNHGYCGYDGGDCCEKSCPQDKAYECGTSNGYSCRDPAAL
jgi:hypothetical protein